MYRVIDTLYGRRIPFTTCCMATLDLGRGQLHWALAGHPPPVIRSKTGTRSSATLLVQGLREPVPPPGTSVPKSMRLTPRCFIAVARKSGS